MNSEWLYVSLFLSLFTLIGYVCIYIVSISDYVSNVNFSAGTPERKEKRYLEVELDLVYKQWNDNTSTFPWGMWLQTKRGCYAEAIEQSPVLHVELDKCGASVDWQIQFAQLYCRQGLSQGVELVRSDYIWLDI